MKDKKTHQNKNICINNKVFLNALTKIKQTTHTQPQQNRSTPKPTQTISRKNIKITKPHKDTLTNKNKEKRTKTTNTPRMNSTQKSNQSIKRKYKTHLTNPTYTQNNNQINSPSITTNKFNKKKINFQKSKHKPNKIHDKTCNKNPYKGSAYRPRPKPTQKT